MDLAAAEQLEDVTGVQIEQPAEGLLLPRHAETPAVRRLLVVAELDRLPEDPHRQPELVVLGEVDEVRLGDGQRSRISGSVKYASRCARAPPIPLPDVYLLFLFA
jgi:hypothetical protein